MAYNKRTWATGNVVGAVDLNRMEGGIEENHPGYEYKEEIVTLWEGSVTTEGEEEKAYTIFSRTEQIVADKLRVTFNGTTYVCEKIVKGEDIIYGGYVDGDRDFSKYPFIISSGTDSYGIYNEIDTKTAGTYTLKIEADNSTITTTEGFQKAVKSVGDSGYECTTSLEEVFSESGATTKEEGGFIARYALDYATAIDANEIKVVFNGTEYICPKMVRGTSVGYGSSTPDFEDYPFTLASGSNSNQLYTPDPMDFEITVFVHVTTATVTPCFEEAVKTVMDGKGVKVIHIEDGEESGFICDTSCDEILEILQNGGYVVASYYGEFYNLDVVDVDLTPETPSAPIRSKAPSLKSKGSGSTITFAKVVINTDTQQAEIRGFTFDTSDCSITYFPNSL